MAKKIKTLLSYVTLLVLSILSSNNYAADLPNLYEKIRILVVKSGQPEASIPTLFLSQDEDSWPTTRESFAYAQTEPHESSIHALTNWGLKASDDQAVFVLAHELSHVLCNHIPKMWGLYSQYTHAVGLDITLLAEGAASDISFIYSSATEARSMEDEADHVGAFITNQLGYDPTKGAEEAIGESTESRDHLNGKLRIQKINKDLLSSPYLLNQLITQCQMRDPNAY